MKTIRLLYPDYVSGGLETYYFGSNLLAHILPQNNAQPLIKVAILPPDGTRKPITDGIYGKDEVLGGIKDAVEIKTAAQKYGVTPAQLCIRYTLERGFVLLPKTANADHMKSNAELDFEITKEKMASLSALKNFVDYGETVASPYSAESKKYVSDEEKTYKYDSHRAVYRCCLCT
ncbi:aldo/keto reductase [Treponema parvum]|nr:aldo/keto reductase [Treponema parvum]